MSYSFYMFWQDLGAIANPMFKGKGPAMLKNNYPTAFPLKHQQKDMRLALALGDENAVAMPVAAAANEVSFSFIEVLNNEEFISLFPLFLISCLLNFVIFAGINTTLGLILMINLEIFFFYRV